MNHLRGSALRRMEESDLLIVLAWRNAPEVRRFMYSQHEIALAEHTNWFRSSISDPSRHLLIFERDGCASGFVNLRVLGAGHRAEWGFYLAPDAQKGSGRQLGREALKYAFVTAGVHKLCGEALSYNQRSIQFHLSLGFTQEGVLRHHHFDGTNYHDVLCFGLLEPEWRTQT